MYIFEILKKEEIDELISLIEIVFKRESKYVISKTKWAFDNDHSCVIVAKYEGKIVASRGGFDWPLRLNGQAYKAVQFHGTCVHPDHRRKGLFSKLNTEYIELAKNKDVDCIFNVSLKNSRAGYEKLGWKYIRGFHRLTYFHSPYKFIKSRMSKNVDNKSVGEQQYIPVPTIPAKFLEARNSQFKNKIHTNFSVDFLEWRLNNREEKYRIHQTANAWVIYKIVQIDTIKSIIFGDFFLIEKSNKLFRDTMKEIIKKEKPDISYTYISRSHPYFKFYLTNFYLPNPFNLNLNFGIKELSNGNNLVTENWASSFLDIDTF